MGGDGALKCREMLARNHRLALRICAPGFTLDSFTLLQQWQRERLASSYSDLRSQPGCRPACDFFLSELYGGLDFTERDQDMEKVMPVMIRFLSDKILMSLADAFELQAISLEFDLEMAEILRVQGLRKLNDASYGAVYRRCNNRPLRERQIRLIRQLGLDLARLVHRRFMMQLVRLLRGPAHATGFGKLQVFLEDGLGAFKKLDDPKLFIDTIYQRESQSMQKLFDGEKHPFRL